jgi:hypothetical protein
MAFDMKPAKEEAVKLLLRPNRNIVGVGIGKKVKDGKATPQDCVRVYVVSKFALNDLTPNSLVPTTFLGVPTDVIEIGRFGRTGRPQPRKDTTPRPGSAIRVKTLAPNVNEGQTGTLGALVTDGVRRYILSCNHILAVNGRVPKGAEVVSADFVGTEDPIAKPGYFIGFDRGSGNSVDCALALLPTGAKVQATFPDGLALSPDGPADPQSDTKVTKFGAATGRTNGAIVDTDADLYIDYSFGTFRFEHQVIIDSGSDDIYFAAAGDSGSLVVDTATTRPIALIFGASGRFAVACPLGMALEQLAKKLNVAKLSVVV